MEKGLLGNLKFIAGKAKDKFKYPLHERLLRNPNLLNDYDSDRFSHEGEDEQAADVFFNHRLGHATGANDDSTLDWFKGKVPDSHYHMMLNGHNPYDPENAAETDRLKGQYLHDDGSIVMGHDGPLYRYKNPLEYADDSLEDFENTDKDKEFAPRVAKSRQLFRDYIATHAARHGKGRDTELEKDALRKLNALNDYAQIPGDHFLAVRQGQNPYSRTRRDVNHGMLLRGSDAPIKSDELLRGSQPSVSTTPNSQLIKPSSSTNNNVDISKYIKPESSEMATVRKSFDIVIIVKAIGNVIDPQEQAELEQALKEKYKTVEPHQLKDSSSVFVLRDGSIVMAPRNHIHWDMAHSVLHDKIAPKEYPEDDPDDHTDYIKELMHRSGATRVGTFDRGVDAHGIHPLTADAATSIGQIVKHNPRHFTGYAEHPSDVFKSRENDNFGQFQSDLVRVNGEPIHSRSVPVHSDLIDPETGIRNDADIRQSAQGVLKFAAPRKKNNVIAAQSNYYKALDKMAPDLTKTKLEGLRMPSRDVLLAFVMSKANASSNSRRRNMKFKIVKATDYPNRPGQLRFKFPGSKTYANPSELMDKDLPKSMQHDGYDVPDSLYHVTTNRDKVLNSGLLSRSELPGNVGLGGGAKNESPHMISTTWDPGKAQQIEDGLKLAAKAARDEVPASHLFDHVAERYGNYNDYLGDYVKSHLINYGVPHRVLDDDYDGDDTLHDHLDNNVKGGESKYNFLQGLDDAFGQDESADTDKLFSDRIGYTAPYEAMKNVDPEQVHTFKVKALKGSKPITIHNEQELRFRPEDLDIDVSDYNKSLKG